MMSLFFLHHSPGTCIPCTAPCSGERKGERPLFLDSGSGCEFLAELCCGLVSLCTGWYLEMALDMCAWMQVLLFLCLPPFCRCLYVCMRVEFECFCLCVYSSAFSCVCLCLFSVCLMCWILHMLLSVPVFMQPMIVCIYPSQLWMYIPVSIFSYVSCFPVLKGVQRSHYVARLPLVWHAPAVHRQVIDCVCFFYAAWSWVAQAGVLEF